jgi:hypothetical protein
VGWCKEYHPALPGTRHRVAVINCGCLGTLVERNGDLRLLAEGNVLRPEDEIRWLRQVVRNRRTGEKRERIEWFKRGIERSIVKLSLDEQATQDQTDLLRVLGFTYPEGELRQEWTSTPDG